MRDHPSQLSNTQLEWNLNLVWQEIYNFFNLTKHKHFVWEVRSDDSKLIKIHYLKMTWPDWPETQIDLDQVWPKPKTMHSVLPHTQCQLPHLLLYRWQCSTSLAFHCTWLKRNISYNWYYYIWFYLSLCWKITCIDFADNDIYGLWNLNSYMWGNCTLFW